LTSEDGEGDSELLHGALDSNPIPRRTELRPAFAEVGRTVMRRGVAQLARAAD